MQKTYVTLSEAAYAASITRQHLHTLLRKGDGPPIYKYEGGKVLFDLDDVETWINARLTKEDLLRPMEKRRRQQTPLRRLNKALALQTITQRTPGATQLLVYTVANK